MSTFRRLNPATGDIPYRDEWTLGLGPLRPNSDGSGYVVSYSQTPIGEVRRVSLPSALRRGRAQVRPSWQAYRLSPGSLIGPIGSPSPRTGRTIYEHPTRAEAVEAVLAAFLGAQP